MLLAVRRRLETLTLTSSHHASSSVPDRHHFPPFHFRLPPPPSSSSSSLPAPFEVTPPSTPPSCSPPPPPLRPRRHRHRRGANFSEALTSTTPVDALPSTLPHCLQSLSPRVEYLNTPSVPYTSRLRRQSVYRTRSPQIWRRKTRPCPR